MRRRALLAPTRSSLPLRSSATVRRFSFSFPLTHSLTHSLSHTHTLFSSDHLILSSKRTTNPVGYRMLLLLFVSCFSHSILLLVLLTPFVFLPLLSLCPSQTSSLVLLPPLARRSREEKRGRRELRMAQESLRVSYPRCCPYTRNFIRRDFSVLYRFFSMEFSSTIILSLSRVSFPLAFFSFPSHPRDRELYTSVVVWFRRTEICLCPATRRVLDDVLRAGNFRRNPNLDGTFISF